MQTFKFYENSENKVPYAVISADTKEEAEAILEMYEDEDMEKEFEIAVRLGTFEVSKLIAVKKGEGRDYVDEEVNALVEEILDDITDVFGIDSIGELFDERLWDKIEYDIEDGLMEWAEGDN